MLVPEITAPTEMPVTLAYVKAQAVVDFDDDDELLSEYINAAVSHLDGHAGIMGRAVMPQAVVQRMPDFSCLTLPYGKATSITAVNYYDTDGVMQAVPAAQYTLLNNAGGSYVHFIDAANIPSAFVRPDAVAVTYQAGYASAAAVPSAIKLAIVMMCSEWYENRTGTNEGRVQIRAIPNGVHDLLAAKRLVGV